MFGFLKKMFTGNDNVTQKTLPKSKASISRASGVDVNVPFGMVVDDVYDGFDDVMMPIELDDQIKIDLFRIFSDMFHTGCAARDIIKDFHSVLIKEDWGWPDLERWKVEFTKRGVVPYSWKKIIVSMDYNDVESTVCDLRISDMKKAVSENGLEWPKPSPKKRDEIETAFLKSGITLEQVLETPCTSERLEEIKIKKQEARIRAETELLTHTIMHRCYTLSHHRKRQKLNPAFTKGRSLKCISGGGCVVEDEFAKKWNKGEIAELPPFYPGDRCMITSKRRS